MDRRQGRSKLMIQEVIDQSKAELELKQKLTAEKEARARAGKANQGMGKAAAPWAKKVRRPSATSSEASDCIVLDSLGNYVPQTILPKLTIRSKIRSFIY